MATALSLHLPHFGLDRTRRTETAEASAEAPPEPVVPLRDPVAEAFEKGRAEGAAEAQAAFERKLEVERAGFASELDGERRRLSETVAEQLNARLEAELKALADTVGDHVAAVLRPLVERAAADRAVEELGQVLAGIVGDGASSVRIAGPEPLLGRLRDRIDASSTPVAFEEAETADISVTVDGTQLETRLAAWQRLVAQAIDDGR